MRFQASYMSTVTLAKMETMDGQLHIKREILSSTQAVTSTNKISHGEITRFCRKEKKTIAGDLHTLLLRLLSVTSIQLRDSQKKGINIIFLNYFFREWRRCWQDKFSSPTYQWRSQAFCLQGKWSRGSIKWTSGTW